MAAAHADNNPIRHWPRRRGVAAHRLLRDERVAAAAALELLESRLLMSDTSFPVILQWFESRYDTIEDRAADIFAAGYGSIYTPPPGRADQGGYSVGYDQYDRFDLGKPGSPTLYGTETGLKQTVNLVHRLGADYYLDFVINHNGYSSLSSVDGNGHSFYNAGGYPGMVITLPNAIDGDFNSAFEWGDVNGRLAGLLDIDHATNHAFVRNPVPGFANNIRAGTQEAFGRIANVPDESNRRFYPDRNLQPIVVFDPVTGEGGIQIFPFNNGNPLAGDPTSENATGYLMRNAQWLVQAIGVDGFRIDAAKHIEGFAMDFFDRSVYRSSFRSLLNGQQKQIFSFSEVYDGNQDYLQTFVKKNINPGDPGRIGGNRDVLDFPLYFALRDNLTGNGFENDWRDVRNATFDLHDDGLHNGSQGVMFIGSHDEFQPFLGNVAAAYTLMQPGNAVIYFNGKEFGDNRDFPKNGRGDALGGVYGNAIPGLVQIRNSHGRGNYIERWSEKENFAFEREASSVVLLSNRLDSGFDSRTIQVNFAPGTKLIELTGNASNPNTDPFNDIPEVVEVFNDNGVNKINVRFLRNSSNGSFHGNGYLIYGLPEPEAINGGLQLTNVSQVLQGDFPVAGNGQGSLDYQNGTTRLSDLHVITSDTFQAKLKTVRVNLLGSIRDIFADGDNALIRIDGGVDVNGNGFVDYTTPGTQSYGFDEFHTKKSPLWNNPNADGEFIQTINTASLSEGVHFIEVRAFRHRDDGGPAIFSSFKKSIYVDRLKPNSTVQSFNAFTSQFNENRQLVVRSTDMTADNIHVLWDLPAALTDAQVIGMVNSGNRANQIDRDLFTQDRFGVTHGNHVATVVTFEPTGNVNVQRNAGLFTSTVIGRGLGDLDFDGFIQTDDVDAFATIYLSSNAQFNPAADMNGDGLVNDADLFALGDAINAAGADQATRDAYTRLILPPMIAQVYVDSTHWTPEFRGQWGSGQGYPVPSGGSQLTTIPWTNVNRIHVRFSENVSIGAAALSLGGVNTASAGVTSFAYDSSTFVATWTLVFPVNADKWFVTLSDSVADGFSDALDGEWANPSQGGDAWPSGDGIAGGNFQFRFDAVPGDVNGNTQVRSSDVILVRNAQFQLLGGANYSPMLDVNGDGRVSSSDLILTRNMQFTGLPDGEPGGGTPSAPLSMVASAPTSPSLAITSQQDTQSQSMALAAAALTSTRQTLTAPSIVAPLLAARSENVWNDLPALAIRFDSDADDIAAIHPRSKRRWR